MQQQPYTIGLGIWFPCKRRLCRKGLLSPNHLHSVLLENTVRRDILNGRDQGKIVSYMP